MEEKIYEVLRKHKLPLKKRERLIVDLLDLFIVSVSDSSDFELQRLFDWLQDAKREPAQTKFTAGMTRNVAREFEYLLKHSR